MEVTYDLLCQTKNIKDSSWNNHVQLSQKNLKEYILYIFLWKIVYQ